MLKTIGQQLDDGRWFTESAERNKGPIVGELKRILPATGLVLEVASGTGQHVSYFAEALPNLVWQPSDADAAFRRSILAWVTHKRLGNVLAPIELDVCRPPWPIAQAEAVVCINMLHVAPWAATRALFAGADRILARDGVLFVYGPYRRFGGHTAPSNEAFDMQLRASDPDWGLRDIEAVVDLASEAGFALSEIIDMPANNLSVVFRKPSPQMP